MTTTQPEPAEYRIDELARHSGNTVRTVRGYQDRGLLPRPERRGRANVYGERHLVRLRRIAGLLERGYTLASIKELLEAWDSGRDLGGVLGLVAEVDGPWSDEEATRVTRAELAERLNGGSNDAVVAEAVELGILERIPGRADEFLVPSPQELAVAVELYSAGVPLDAIAGQLREVRGSVEYLASRFLAFSTEHVFHEYLDPLPTDEKAAEAAALVRRLRPLAQQTIDAELARAMRTLATRELRHRLDGLSPADADQAVPTATEPTGAMSGTSATASADASVAPAAPAPWVQAPPEPATESGGTRGPSAAPTRQEAGAAEQPAEGELLRLPTATLRAVRGLVGEAHTAAFVAAAADREVRARLMDSFVADAPACRSQGRVPPAREQVAGGGSGG